MSWRDRDYNDGGGWGGESYLSNPAGLLSLSVPFGNWFGARVRLHFWLLLSLVFMLAHGLQFRFPGGLTLFVLATAVLLISLLLHEFGHRLAARYVGGWHNEFVLWPAGSLTHPTAPPTSGATLIAHGAGIATSAAICLLSGIGFHLVTHHSPEIQFNPLIAFSVDFMKPVHSWPATILNVFYLCNLGIVMINVLPFYWFDGGYVLQAILWPFSGLYHATNITCILGMVVAAPMFFYSIMGQDFIGMIFWALLFASAFTRRRELAAGGTHEMEDAIAMSAMGGAEPSPRQRAWKSPWFKTKQLSVQSLRKEQEQVDAILAKVHEHGMHSLTWRERRTLKKATERQKKREKQFR